MDRFERRFVLDFIVWEESGIFYYLFFELRVNLSRGFWDELFELFLLLRVFDLAFRVFRKSEFVLLK